jgi:MFS family permease
MIAGLTRVRILPASADADARVLVGARALRGFVDGLTAITLASYLSGIGLSSFQIGALVTGALFGSAVLTLALGLFGVSISVRRTLVGASVAMALTGIGFAGFTEFGPLLVVAIAGTLNPSAADVSIFLPTEQAALPETVRARDRTALFARYNLAGRLAAAFGALASGLVVATAGWLDVDVLDAQRAVFLLYSATAVLLWALYRRLSARPVLRPPPGVGRLSESRGTVLKLSALFSLDSLGGGFAVDSLLALWLFERHGLDQQTVGLVFFVGGLLLAFSLLVSPWLADRIGLVNTMVFTHLPANLCLVAAALVPTGGAAVALLLCRNAFSQMDVPARQSYVTSVVPAHERAAAVSVTNVPRSLAAATTPLAAGWLLGVTTFGWPLVLAGSLKAIYDVLLLRSFGSVRMKK